MREQRDWCCDFSLVLVSTEVTALKEEWASLANFMQIVELEDGLFCF